MWGSRTEQRAFAFSNFIFSSSKISVAQQPNEISTPFLMQIIKNLMQNIIANIRLVFLFMNDFKTRSHKFV